MKICLVRVPAALGMWNWKMTSVDEIGSVRFLRSESGYLFKDGSYRYFSWP